MEASMKHQRGFVWWAYLILFAVVAGAGSVVVVTYNSAIKQAEVLKAQNANLSQANQEQIAANTAMIARNKAISKALAAREHQRNVALKKARELDAKLNDLLKQPEVKKWADESIPLSVVNSLRNTTSPANSPQNGTGAGTSKPVSKSGYTGIHIYPASNKLGLTPGR